MGVKFVLVFVAFAVTVEGVVLREPHHVHGPAAHVDVISPPEHLHIRQTAVGYSQQNVIERPKPYSFAFEAQNEFGAKLSRQEVGDEAGVVKGNYGYTDPSGIYRHVDYIADADGFRASVRTNEPGTDSANPADVEMHAEPVQVVVDRPTHVRHVDVATPVVHHAPPPQHVEVVAPVVHRVPDHLRIVEAIQRARTRPHGHIDQHAHRPVHTAHRGSGAALLHQDAQLPGAAPVHRDTHLGRGQVVRHVAPIVPAPVVHHRVGQHIDIAPVAAVHHDTGHHTGGASVHQEVQNPGSPVIHHDAQLGRTAVHQTPAHAHGAPVVHHTTEHVEPVAVAHHTHVAAAAAHKTPGLRVQATLPNGFSYSY